MPLDRFALDLDRFASTFSPRRRHQHATPLQGVPRLISCAICFVCGGWTHNRFCVGCGAAGFSSRMQALQFGNREILVDELEFLASRCSLISITNNC
jgi:hypothetical protein